MPWTTLIILFYVFLSEIQLIFYDWLKVKTFKGQGDLLEQPAHPFTASLRWTLINSLIRAVSCESDPFCTSMNLLNSLAIQELITVNKL